MSLVDASKDAAADKSGTALAKVDDNAPLGVQLKHRAKQFEGSLPAHMPVERFMRVVMIAVQNNPALWKADRRSFWNACSRAASDGLLPDGREGALTIFNTNTKTESGKWISVPKVSWMPMIAGLRKKVRNSATISTWDVQAVFQRDNFEYELGDNPFIRHRPYMPKSLERKEGESDEEFAARWRTHCNPGPLVAAYSVAVLKTGEKSRDVMTRQEIEYVRDTYSKRDSKGNFSQAWVKSFGEMSKKTVARRHSKVLPMSTDLDDLIRRDDELYDVAGASDKQIDKAKRPKELDARMEAVLAGIAPEDEPPDDGGGSGGGVVIEGGEYMDPETGEITPIKSAGGSAKPDAKPDAKPETKKAETAATSGPQQTADASTPSAAKAEAGAGKVDVAAPADAGQARKRAAAIRAEIDARKAELDAIEKNASNAGEKSDKPADDPAAKAARIAEIRREGQAVSEVGTAELTAYLEGLRKAREDGLVSDVIKSAWREAAKAADAKRAASKPAEPKGELSAHELAVLDDLVETGSARADGGEKPLRHFLDNDLTEVERKLIPPQIVSGWIKTAKAVDARAAKASGAGGRS